MADGYIFDKSKIVVHLSQVDLKHLKLIARTIGFNGPILKTCYYDKKTNKEKKSCWLVLNSQKIVRDLELNFNICRTRKIKNTNIAPPSELSERNQFAFMAGLIDGDGCVCIVNGKRKKYLELTVVGSSSLIIWVRDKACRFLKSEASFVCKQGTLTRFKISGSSALTFLRHVVNKSKCSDILLKRKWCKIEKFEH